MKKAGKGIFAKKTLSPALAAICGAKSLPRTEVTKKIWGYIKSHKLNEVTAYCTTQTAFQLLQSAFCQSLTAISFLRRLSMSSILMTIQFQGRIIKPDSALKAVFPVASLDMLKAQLKGSIWNLTLISQPNDRTFEGSFSSVSTPNFATKYSLESS